MRVLFPVNSGFKKNLPEPLISLYPVRLVRRLAFVKTRIPSVMQHDSGLLTIIYCLDILPHEDACWICRMLNNVLLTFHIWGSDVCCMNPRPFSLLLLFVSLVHCPVVCFLMHRTNFAHFLTFFLSTLARNIIPFFISFFRISGERSPKYVLVYQKLINLVDCCFGFSNDKLKFFKSAYPLSSLGGMSWKSWGFNTNACRVDVIPQSSSDTN